MDIDIEIREYTENDWESIKILILESKYYGPSVLKSEKIRIEFYSQVPEKGRTFVAVIPEEIKEKSSTEENEPHNQDQVIAYMVVDFFGRAIFILSLIVAKQHQLRGVGKKLVQFATKFGEADPQYNILRGFADDRNLGIHTFLLKQGFKTCGYINHDLNFNHSTIHYVLHLRKEKDDSEILISA
jgi:ribosomal protein S18 acetylase RimI-like enzyme